MSLSRHNSAPSDTPPAIREILYAGYRRMSPTEKFERIRELNQLLEALALADIRSKHPNTTEREQRIRASARRMPVDLFSRVHNRMCEFAFREQTSMPADPLKIVGRLVTIFEQNGIVYWLGGSMASSVYGEFRATQDVDFVADLKYEHIPLLVAACETDFYIDDEMIRDAIDTQTSFNLIYLETMYKADIFVMKQTAWSHEEKNRRQQKEMRFGDEVVPVYIASVEDMILQKLAWYRLGGGVSDRQWSDVQGMLNTQAETLDYDYLQRWAQDLHLTDLLTQAYADAEIK